MGLEHRHVAPQALDTFAVAYGAGSGGRVEAVLDRPPAELDHLAADRGDPQLDLPGDRGGPVEAGGAPLAHRVGGGRLRRGDEAGRPAVPELEVRVLGPAQGGREA